MGAEGTEAPSEVPWTQEALPQGCGPLWPAALEARDQVPSPILHLCLTQAVPLSLSFSSCLRKVNWADTNGSDVMFEA